MARVLRGVFGWLLMPTLLMATAAAADRLTARVFDFENAKLDELPPAWTAAQTGAGPGSVWKVIEDPTAPSGPKVLSQVSSAGPKPSFNLCVANDTRFADLDLSVSLKAVRGKIDQGGGLVWRYRDAKNYYIARANPLESNFRVYKVVDGKRTQLQSVDVEIPTGKWFSIRVVHLGSHIQCYLNGALHLDVSDDTFRDAGPIGLWSKADAVTNFDALRISSPHLP